MAAGDEHGSTPVCSAHGINSDRMSIRPRSTFVRYPIRSSVSPVLVAEGHRSVQVVVAQSRGEEL